MTQVTGDMTSGEMTLGRLDRLPSKARKFLGWPISMIDSVDKTKLCKEESIEQQLYDCYLASGHAAKFKLC